MCVRPCVSSSEPEIVEGVFESDSDPSFSAQIQIITDHLNSDIVSDSDASVQCFVSDLCNSIDFKDS